MSFTTCCPISYHFTVINPSTNAPATMCGKPVRFATEAEAQRYADGGNWYRSVQGMALMFVQPLNTQES